MLLSDVCLSVCRLSVAYIGPKSGTERPMKTKTGTEVDHVTRDSDTTFKVKRSKVNVFDGHLWICLRPYSALLCFYSVVTNFVK